MSECGRRVRRYKASLRKCGVLEKHRLTKKNQLVVERKNKLEMSQIHMFELHSLKSNIYERIFRTQEEKKNSFGFS